MRVFLHNKINKYAKETNKEQEKEETKQEQKKEEEDKQTRNIFLR